MTSPSVPRPSATVLIVRDHPLEVLMVSRHADQDFSSALVFPGGLVDASDADEAWLPHVAGADGLTADERALRIAAFRETFEECGLLLASRRDGSPLGQIEAIGDFRDIVVRSDAVLPLNALVHFGHWITPEPVARRYDTHFFLATAPLDQVARCDGSEAVEAIWIEPARVLEAAAAERQKLLLPTRMNLRRLAASPTVEDALTAARTRPVITVVPRIEQRPDGIALMIPVEAGYGRVEEFHPK